MQNIKDSLSVVFKQVLELDQDELEDIESFQELGIASINVAELIHAINMRFDLRLPSSIILECSSIDELAHYINAQLVRQKSVSADKQALTDSEAPVFTATASNQSENSVADIYESSVDNEVNNDADDIAIIGLSCRSAGADDQHQFWQVISQGRDCIGDITDPDWLGFLKANSSAKAVPTKLGMMANTEYFDSDFFHISPKEAELMDVTQRVLMEECYHALEDAGYSPASLSGRAVGTMIGTQSIAPKTHDLSHFACMGTDVSILASRIAYFLNLKGPALAVNTACSSSLVALDMGCQKLKSREIDMAMVGGITIYTHPAALVLMNNVGMLSPSGESRPFDNSADGIVVGDGVGVLVLKRLTDAQRDQDMIYGVVRGHGTNHDGKTSGTTVPSFLSQSELLMSIYQRNNIAVDDIQYMEAHGTGTKLGDPIEVHAIAEAFSRFTEKTQFCAIGSLKGNVGHTTAASGVLSVIKVLLSMKHQQIPPSIKFNKENDQIDFAHSPVYVNTELNSWPENSSGRRLATVSAFGFSGTNAHVVIESYDDVVFPVTPRQRYGVVLSARNEEQLKQQASNCLAVIEEWQLNTNVLPELAYTLQVGREEMEERLAIEVGSMAELIEKLRAYVQNDICPDGMLKGRAHQGKEVLSLLAGDDDMKMTVAAWVNKGKLNKLLSLWVKGMSVDWSLLYSGNPPQRMSLPGYPFARTGYSSAMKTFSRHYQVSSEASVSHIPVTLAASCVSAIGSVTNAIDQTLQSFTECLKQQWDPVADQNFREITDGVTRLGEWMLLAVFHRMGVFSQSSERYDVANLQQQLGITPLYQPLFEALLNILIKAGLLVRKQEYLIVTEAAHDNVVGKVNEIKRTLISRMPEIAGHIHVLEVCIESYPEVLTGRKNHMEVLFPDGSMELVQSIYKSNQYHNQLAADIIETAVANRLQQHPYTVLKILEVGAGTGETSKMVLDKIAQYQEHIQYTYTDISHGFIQHGEREFGNNRPFMKFKVLNVENSPPAQGFDAHDYDIVFASNVLHATQDINNTLQQIKKLLHKNGMLVVIELTQVMDFFTLIFGLTTGWWLFSDKDNRLTDSPLLSSVRWRQLLEENGFGRVRVSDLPSLGEDTSSETVIIAESNGVVSLAADENLSVKHYEDDIPVPAESLSVSEKDGQTEVSELENNIAAIWKDLLGVQVLGVHDNFQMLGGDSIIVTQVISRLKDSFPFEVDLSELFGASTVAESAEIVEKELIYRIKQLSDESSAELMAI
ncbi:beta-ketoacyl synthase N-terminal-like domain-containing protein [Gynuella sp.]|uniref:beta-ketoacyl synthase N-terminal-like domain-containing protein n=1 Tax=Gynuella sp. TaxID=2969146 RepID=UPI003D13E844